MLLCDEHQCGQSWVGAYFKRDYRSLKGKTIHEMHEAEKVFVRLVWCEFVDRSCRSGNKTRNQTKALLEVGRLTSILQNAAIR